MNASFWLEKWKNNNIAFHNSEANPLLIKYFKTLSLAAGSRIFLPLCGKTLDIAWLLSQGYRVVGAELSEIAIEQLFMTLGKQPKIVEVDKLKHYSAEDIDIFVGDIFDLSSSVLGAADAIYDRAALVALPKEVRNRYTAHLMKITAKAPQMIICYVYDQALMEGPPFSVSDEEIYQHYQDSYMLSLAASTALPNGLKGKCPAKENVWLLKNK
ncbi:MAG: thiopurine S-methyltransferase [Phormidesmis sp.]